MLIAERGVLRLILQAGEKKGQTVAGAVYGDGKMDPPPVLGGAGQGALGADGGVRARPAASSF